MPPTQTPPTPTTAKTIHTHLVSIHESLALALHFLSGFHAANWPPPSKVAPTHGRASTQTSQLDADIAVARHLSIAATLERVVGLLPYTRSTSHSTSTTQVEDRAEAEEKQKDVKNVDVVVVDVDVAMDIDIDLCNELHTLAQEARDISLYLVHAHGVSGVQREEMRELKALREWYAEVLLPVVERALERGFGGRGGEGGAVLQGGKENGNGIGIGVGKEKGKERGMGAAGSRSSGFHPRSFRARMGR